VEARSKRNGYRALLDAKLTELVLYAKELCPEAVVETSTIQYEDEDGHVDVFPPPAVPEAQEERIDWHWPGARRRFLRKRACIFSARFLTRRSAKEPGSLRYA